MKKILVAVDGSDASRKGAQLAADIALRFGATLSLVYVVPRLLLPPDVYGLTLADVERENRAWAEKLVAEVLADVGETGVKVETAILSGPPAESIAEAAGADPEVGMVVVGSRGHGAVARMFLGSVSDRLVHISSKPVLVVH